MKRKQSSSNTKHTVVYLQFSSTFHFCYLFCFQTNKQNIDLFGKKQKVKKKYLVTGQCGVSAPEFLSHLRNCLFSLIRKAIVKSLLMAVMQRTKFGADLFFVLRCCQPGTLQCPGTDILQPFVTVNNAYCHTNSAVYTVTLLAIKLNIKFPGHISTNNSWFRRNKCKNCGWH